MRGVSKIWAVFFALAVLTVTENQTYAVSQECTEFFKQEGVTPGSEGCELRCATLPTSMATFTCPSECRNYCASSKVTERPSLDNGPLTDKQRRDELQKFAEEEFKNENRCDALANIIDKAAELVDGEDRPAEVMREDLKLILIGEDLQNGRNRGFHFAGRPQNAQGFREELRDPGNQIQHAMAGVYIGSRYGRLGCMGARLLEREPQDDRLYMATCPLGYDLSDTTYTDLGTKLRKAIGDSTCQEED